MIWSLFKSLSIEKPRPSNKLLVSDEKYLQYRKANQEHEKSIQSQTHHDSN